VLRRTSIGFLLFGAILLAVWHHHSIFETDTLPFPNNGLSVNLSVNVKSDGDYYLDVSMPKEDKSLGLSSETIPCSLLVNINQQDKSLIQENITSLMRYGEYGFSNIQYYQSKLIHLRAGEYSFRVTSHANCNAAISRGAAFSLARDTTHITERVIATQLLMCGGIFFFCLGCIGIIIAEFKWA
jgi:hypothetical protein